MAWTRFLLVTLALTAGFMTMVGAVVLLVDPFDVLGFSPSFARAPMDANQRYAYPAVARSPAFESAVFGTSVGRLLRPEVLESRLGGSFANLSMNAATPWEQAQIFGQFRAHHEVIGTVVFEVDLVWCKRFPDEDTKRPFPEWMYDADPWNDLAPHLSLYALEQAGRQAAYLLGLRPARFAANGYARYLPNPADYDLERVQRKLREQSEWKEQTDRALEVAEREALVFPYHPLMAEMLGSLPKETSKILLFPPIHRLGLARPGSKSASIHAECKARLAAMALATSNAAVFDFMIDSAITREDGNYWDGYHTTVATADRLVSLIAEGLLERRGRSDLFTYQDARPGD